MSPSNKLTLVCPKWLATAAAVEEEDAMVVADVEEEVVAAVVSLHPTLLPLVATDGDRTLKKLSFPFAWVGRGGFSISHRPATALTASL